MWIAVATIAVALFIIKIEVPSLRRKQLKKELWVFATLLLLGSGICILMGLHADFPSPAGWIITVYKPIYETIFGQ
ncbi:hypothetical protein I6N90_03280 [Paenibacillus sp. GSMTC-2017]|uniref:hypothetical protein n=1 Tax=Paenibacillus sp. GSMTC-2017 TaxID=2794350 RepID=UPI0018D775EA|nr:hypothetical protein [Paenibacillus sp. GSMTC-2017]MBH5316833.1 hypothetical protein [Paenibacillus sp. GSMTC-2017]